MTVRGQRVFVHTGFRRHSRIPAEAAVIEREDVIARRVQRLQVIAYATVDRTAAGRAEQDPVRRHPLVCEGKGVQADPVRRPELDDTLTRDWPWVPGAPCLENQA